jgi:hypothetical protein
MNDYLYSVRETEHGAEYLGELPFDDLDALVRNRPVSDDEREKFYRALRRARVGGTEETLYIRSDWTLGAVRSRHAPKGS